MTGATARKTAGLVREWLAWGRRSRANRVLFGITASLAAFVTGAFAWATLHPAPGDFARYFAFYWVWGLCAVALLFELACVSIALGNLFRRGIPVGSFYDAFPTFRVCPGKRTDH